MVNKRSINQFEKSLDELNKLVENMEQGDLTLEESLKSFEKGIKLTRSCQKALENAEQKIQILMDEDGENLKSTSTDDAKN